MTQTDDEILAERLALIERDGDLYHLDVPGPDKPGIYAQLLRDDFIVRLKHSRERFWNLSKRGIAALEELRAESDVVPVPSPAF